MNMMLRRVAHCASRLTELIPHHTIGPSNKLLSQTHPQSSVFSSNEFTPSCHFSSLNKHTDVIASPRNMDSLLKPEVFSLVQTASYKGKVILRKRCGQCRLVKRRGQWFVECDAKPRHKQIEKIAKKHLWKED